eukprot:1810933-Pleurochrysis_carterae.AAC.2
MIQSRSDCHATANAELWPAIGVCDARSFAISPISVVAMHFDVWMSQVERVATPSASMRSSSPAPHFAVLGHAPFRTRI